ncbi:MAG: ComF family protein [Pseudomonadota bacterium]
MANSFLPRFIRTSGLNACYLCETAITSNEKVCEFCFSELQEIRGACKGCALPMQVDQAGFCGQCREKRMTTTIILAAYRYAPPLNFLVHGFKYHQQVTILDSLCNKLNSVIKAAYSEQESLPSTLYPVPLHPKRHRERGYNQAVEIAKRLRDCELAIPVSSQCRRIKNTRSQSELTHAERARNVEAVFEINETVDSHVAIIDDVLTTGATVAALAQTLKESGAKRIDVWCIARAF